MNNTIITAANNGGMFFGLSDTDGTEAPKNKSKINVIYPNGNEQRYFPMLEFSDGEKKFTEIDIITEAVKADRKAVCKRVTTVYFMSPPGLGKTVLAGHLAREYNCPYQIVNCVSSMTDLDLLGSHVLKGGETIWQDGPIPSIIRAANEHGMAILVINELNALSTNAQVGLNSLLDKQHSVVLTLNDNEHVEISEDAHLLVMASMNPDILGVNELQDSVRDRASIILHMDYPGAVKEAELARKITGIPYTVCFQYANVVSEIRALKGDSTITKVPSTRALLDWLHYAKSWTPKVAFDIVLVNRYGSTDAERKSIAEIGRGKMVRDLPVPVVEKKKRDALVTAKAATAQVKDLGDSEFDVVVKGLSEGLSGEPKIKISPTYVADKATVKRGSFVAGARRSGDDDDGSTGTPGTVGKPSDLTPELAHKLQKFDKKKLREIGEMYGISISSVARRIKKYDLEKAGLA